MTETASDQGVWVDDYVTSAGTHVAGHWRKKGAGHLHAGDHEPGGGRHEVRACVEDSNGVVESTGVSDTQADFFTVYAADSAGHQHAVGDFPTRSTAEAAMGTREAKVAAGLQALRRRREALQHSSAESFDYAAFVERNEHNHAQWRQDVAEGRPMDPALRAELESRFGSSDRCPTCGEFTSDDGTHICSSPSSADGQPGEDSTEVNDAGEAVPDGLPAGSYADLKGEERVKAMVADLEASVKAVIEGGQLHRWLDAMASNGLSRWSANNRLLAMVQMLGRGESLDGLHMMGFRQWEKFNRKVSKGAKAVWILAPITRKLVEEDDAGNKTEKHRVVGFKGVPVFNVSDTAGDALPAAPIRPAPGETTPGTLEGLRDRVAAAGYSYDEVEIPDCQPETGVGTLGYTDPKSKQIVVDSRLSPAQKASTIAHELGHVHCGHVDGDYSEYQKHRGRMETEAEAVAYLVTKSRGATKEQSESFSPGYIASWSKGDAKVMHTAIDKAVKAHNKILDGTWPTS